MLEHAYSRYGLGMLKCWARLKCYDVETCKPSNLLTCKPVNPKLANLLTYEPANPPPFLTIDP